MAYLKHNVSVFYNKKKPSVIFWILTKNLQVKTFGGAGISVKVFFSYSSDISCELDVI